MRTALRPDKTRDPLFIIIFSFIFFLLRLPSLFEPHWYGDEGIYQVIGTVLNNGGLLYRDIWDNKPPLLYLLYALFNSDQFTVRLFSLTFGILSVIIFFFLSKKLFLNHFFTTSIFALLLALPTLEGNIANAENFMLLPILTAAFLIFTTSNLSTHEASHHRKIHHSHSLFTTYNLQLTAAGILLGIAFLFKAVAIFDFLAFLSFLIIINLPQKPKVFILKEKEQLLSFVKKALPLVVCFFVPILVTIFYFWTQSAFIDFVRATFSSNVSYVAWQNKLILPLTLLLFKTALLIIAIILIVYKRKSLSINTIFILLWFIFSLYNVFFTQRPYTHYLLTLLPSFSLMVGLIFSETKLRASIAIFFILAFILVLKNFNLYEKTIAYYQNFVSFITGEKSVSSYRAFFDKRTSTDYELATFLKGKVKEKDSIFVWGDNAQVYKLVGVAPPGKYIVAYHIWDNEDGVDSTKEAIEKIKPKFIIVMPDQRPIPFRLMHYFERIKINKVSIYESIL